MDATIAAWLPVGLLESLAASPGGAFVLPVLIAVLTAGFVGFSVPGTLAPMSFVSGLLLGLGGIVAVALGVLVGSHVLFLASRRWLAGVMQDRFGERLARVSEHLGRKGAIYVFIARLTGVPHVVVTAGCAAAPITSRAFLAASLLGMLPAITLAHVAGTAI